MPATITIPDLSDHPRLRQAVEALLRVNRISAHSIVGNLEYLIETEPGYLDHAEQLVGLCLDLAAGYAIDAEQIARHYRTIVLEFIRNQRHFEATGSYRGTELGMSAIRAEVYDNHDYMQAYMFELLLTYAVWVNKYRMLQFFRERFLPRLENRRRLVEIGPGHGYFFSEALTRHARMNGDAFDISPFSLELTQRMLTLRHIDPSRYRLTAGDVREHEHGSYDAMIFSEVVEHVENHASLLAAVRRLVSDHAAPIFFVTAINTAAPDHVLLFSEPDEVDVLLSRHGLNVTERGVYAPWGALDDSPTALRENRTPLVYCAILHREDNHE